MWCILGNHNEWKEYILLTSVKYQAQFFKTCVSKLIEHSLMIDLRHKYHICHNSQNGLYKFITSSVKRIFCCHNCITFNTFWAPFLTNTFIVRNAQLSSKLHGFECYPKPNAVQYWFCLNWGWLSAFRCTLKYRQYVTYCTHTRWLWVKRCFI